MARPTKKGLDYFPLDVDFFSDKKIKRLRAKYGMNGVAVYLYLLCEIYHSGYYIEYDEDLILDISDELNITENSTKQILNYLFSRSLLQLIESKLAVSVKVITAKSIQLRYQAAKKGAKRDIEVEQEFWVLEKNETESFIKVRPVESFSEINNNFSEKNKSNSEKNDIKESKVKKSKEKESITADKSALPSPSEIVELFHSICISYPKVKSLSENRKKAIKARLKTYGYDTIRQVFEKAEASDFMKGKNNRNWSANFDWILKDSNFVKILDGNYDNKPVQQKNTGTLSGGYTAEDYEKIINMF